MFLNITTTQAFNYLPLIIFPAILATLKMLFLSLILGLIIGFFIGVFLVLFSPDGLMPKKLSIILLMVWSILSVLFRSLF